VTEYLLLRAFHPGATLAWRVGVPTVVETISANPLDEALEETMRREAARLAYNCRGAPYSWFDFYDFWA
jgi:hypothetical protein